MRDPVLGDLPNDLEGDSASSLGESGTKRNAPREGRSEQEG